MGGIPPYPSIGFGLNLMNATPSMQTQTLPSFAICIPKSPSWTIPFFTSKFSMVMNPCWCVSSYSLTIAITSLPGGRGRRGLLLLRLLRENLKQTFKRLTNLFDDPLDGYTLYLQLYLQLRGITSIGTINSEKRVTEGRRYPSVCGMSPLCSSQKTSPQLSGQTTASSSWWTCLPQVWQNHDKSITSTETATAEKVITQGMGEGGETYSHPSTWNPSK